MFTFSFGSAFAMTTFEGNLPAMEAGDYDVNGTSVGTNPKGTVGITDAEKDAYVANLEEALKTLDENETYNGAEYSGMHLTNVKNYVKEALEAAKSASTSAVLKQINDNLTAKVATATKKADIKTTLEGSADYNIAGASASTTLYDFELRLAAGTYLLPGYGYFKAGGANRVTVAATDSSTKMIYGSALNWMLDNDYDTKAKIQSDAAKKAFEDALVKVSNDNSVDNVYESDLKKLEPEFVVAQYEWKALTSKLDQNNITDLDATLELEKQMIAFQKKYGTDGATYGTVVDNATKRTQKVESAYNYYLSVNFAKEYAAIKALKSTEYVANKDRIVKLAQAIVAFKDKYEPAKYAAGVTFDYKLTDELAAIENAGDDAYDVAKIAVATVLTAPQRVTASQKSNVEAYAAAYDAYKAEFKDAIYTTDYAGTTKNTAVAGVINKVTESQILALKANLTKRQDLTEDADAKLQAYLNNATVKVTTKALGNGKIRVNARFDAETYNDIVGLCKSDYTISYKFYHKTAKATAFKGPKEKSRNYITYTKASLKKGTKYKFQCGVVIKDKDGKVVAEKSYRASTTGSRICR